MSSPLLIRNVRIITPTAVISQGWLLSEGGKIALIGTGSAPNFEQAEQVDGGGLSLIPGFIDVHVHGAVGQETMDASPDALRAMARFYAQQGVTSFLPTTWTDTNEHIMAALEVIAEVQGQQPDGATIIGVHLEGPYINVDRRGAQRAQDVRRAGRDEALPYLDFGVIRLLSLAPEFSENTWLIDECVRRGVTVSVAHSGATYAQVKAAVDIGLSHATHTYNAMTPLNHREPGVVGAVMALPEIYAELIADNIHVHPAAMQVLYAAKGADRVVLITDSVRGAGLSEGEYMIDERKVIIKDGAVRLVDGTLAGSMLTLNLGLYNFMQATGQPLEKVWQTSSLNAARSIHVADRKGSLEVGKDADLVLVDESVNVHLTVAEGRIVYRKTP